MNLENLLQNAFEVKLIKPECYQIKTGATLPDGKPLYCFLDITPKGMLLSDKKFVLNYMSEYFYLNSPDVKTCIANVTKINKFKIVQGVLFSEIKSEDEIVAKIFQYIMCVAQLVNMYAFFDPPSN